MTLDLLDTLLSVHGDIGVLEFLRIILPEVQYTLNVAVCVVWSEGFVADVVQQHWFFFFSNETFNLKQK